MDLPRMARRGSEPAGLPPTARGGSPEVVSLLKGLFGSQRKLMIITYNLPVVLRKNTSGTLR